MKVGADKPGRAGPGDEGKVRGGAGRRAENTVAAGSKTGAIGNEHLAGGGVAADYDVTDARMFVRAGKNGPERR